jgi:hypothetical protein
MTFIEEQVYAVIFETRFGGEYNTTIMILLDSACI